MPLALKSRSAFGPIAEIGKGRFPTVGEAWTTPKGGETASQTAVCWLALRLYLDRTGKLSRTAQAASSPTRPLRLADYFRFADQREKGALSHCAEHFIHDGGELTLIKGLREPGQVDGGPAGNVRIAACQDDGQSRPLFGDCLSQLQSSHPWH